MLERRSIGMLVACRSIKSWFLVLGTLVVITDAIGADFIPLGHLPSTSFSSLSDVSADGSVVVGFSGQILLGGPAAVGEAFQWTKHGGVNGLGFLSDRSTSHASGVSADGSVIVGFSGSYLGNFADGEAFRWTRDFGMISLGHLSGRNASSSADVSADGSVVVGWSYASGLASAPGETEAFRWTSAGGMVGLGHLPGNRIRSSSYATNVSADGSVVAGWGSSGDSLRVEAFRWTSENGMVGLGNLSGGEFDSYAGGMSSDGSVIVGGSNTALGQSAFRWTSDEGMASLGHLSGGFRSGASDVSANGSVIVGWSDSAIGQQAFAWDATHDMRSVSEVLTVLGIDVTGWRLTHASAISADGTTIVGYGTNPSGQTEAWLADIRAVPEPSAASIMLVGMTALVACRASCRRLGY